jgi:UDP-N-acetylglucosamine 2-epimerase
VKEIIIADIVGARPQFIKLAPVLKAIEKHNQEGHEPKIHEVLIHTGQHYDYEMSGVFFEELGLKSPDYNLGVGSGLHGYQTGEMLKRIEEVVLKEKPDVAIVYGDTNSTLAGALAAAKLHIPVAHIEAGLRSYNRLMAEEYNRVLTDHISDFLFCPTETAVKNLRKEGFENIVNSGKLIPKNYRLPDNQEVPAVINTGDVMYDSVLLYRQLAEEKSRILSKLSLSTKSYALATIHRAENTDNSENLKSIFKGLREISQKELKVILPIHPRTQKRIREMGIESNGLLLIEPVSYLDMLILEKNASVIITDSGGIQKEAFIFDVPCITIRDETEWPETVELGLNVLAGKDLKRITIKAYSVEKPVCPYGDGNASVRILWSLISRGRP